MKRIWDLIAGPVRGDELFSQVLNFIAGLMMTAGGSWIVWEVMRTDDIGSIWLTLFAYLIGLVILVWGLILLVATFAPANSKLAEFADKYFPDTPMMDEALILLVIWCVPAYFVTLVLRLFGVKGRPSQTN